MSAEDLSPAVSDSKPKLWLLVQCERSGGGSSEPFFEVVEASAVNQSKRELMHTGKTIEVRIGNTLVKATIFIISDDRTFLENELRQQIASSKNSKMVNDSSTSSAYRKTATSYNESTEKITFSLERNRKRRKADTISECNANKTELSNHSSASTYANSNPYIPPMTFDQQTQTDPKLYVEPTFGGCSQQLAAVLAKQEHIIDVQQSLSTEYSRTKDQLNEIIEDNQTFKAMLAEVLAKIDQQQSQIFTVTEQKSDRDMRTNENQRDEPVVLFSCDSNNETNHSNQLLNFNSSNEIKNVNIKQIEINNESIVSFSNTNSQLSQSSTASVGEASSSSTIGFGQEIARSDQVKVKKFKSVKEMVTFDWTDGKEDIDPMGQIVIGNNQTTVQRWVMDQIKWTSHSHATRKLLTTLFTREVLASHSLTGKPSPGKCNYCGYLKS